MILIFKKKLVNLKMHGTHVQRQQDVNGVAIVKGPKSQRCGTRSGDDQSSECLGCFLKVLKFLRD
jgi:hypothetical protein